MIQAAPGWADSHLHAFEIAGERYGIPDPEFGFREPVIYEARARLGQCPDGAAALHTSMTSATTGGTRSRLKRSCRQRPARIPWTSVAPTRALPKMSRGLTDTMNSSR
ncbi:IS1096 element passenger TnpR family protein [Burkholderia sp. BCC0322]|uniref:IS1096 element passenger TnpR family protein n=1 Tax=Burkholderia sp. LMG 21824 TaxID=3158172 RepID=UPI001589FC8D